MTLPAVIEEVRPCSMVEARCICCLPTNHEGEHLCGCGGSWTYGDDGLMVPHMFPGGITTEEATQRSNVMVSMLFGSFDDDDYDEEED